MNRTDRIVLFGAMMLTLVGGFNFIDGLVALLNPDYFDDDLLVGSLTAWGWLFVFWGALQIVLGFAIAGGSTVALWPGVAVAVFNVVMQFAFLSSYPLWSAIVIAVDGCVIWAFATRAMQMGTESAAS
jgi:hypothetical protein